MNEIIDKGIDKGTVSQGYKLKYKGQIYIFKNENFESDMGLSFHRYMHKRATEEGWIKHTMN